MKSSIDVCDPHCALGPVRLLAGGGTAFEHRLLESARADQIPGASRQHLARALKVPSAPTPAHLPRALLQSSRFGKYSLVGLGAVALLTAWASRQMPGQRMSGQGSPAPPFTVQHRVELAPASASVEVEARASVSPNGALEASVPSPSVPSPSVPAPGGPSAPRVRTRSATSPAPASTSASTPSASTPSVSTPSFAPARGGLREELRALEAVQSALRSARSSEAERALEDYARRFPAGELALEAELLGVDVALARGERRQAGERARQLLARPDAARYRARLEALSEAAGAGLDVTPRGSESTSSPHSRAEATE
jgi:hypothetical protein